MSFRHLFFPQTIKFPDSAYNRKISLKLYFRQPTLFVDGLIQSGDILTHIWKTGIKKLLPKNFTPQKILILGLGGGSNTILCSKYYPNAQITAVEIDPLMSEIAKKYFGLNKLPNLKIVSDDALNFAGKLKSKDQYDLILLDCFEGKYIPQKLENPEFIQQLKDHTRFFLINRIYWYGYHEPTMKFLRLLSERFFFITAFTRSNIIISLI